MEPAPLPSVFFHPQQQEWPHAWRPSSPWLDARSTFFLPLSSPHLRLASQPPGSPPSFVSASSCPTVDVVRFLDAPAVHARLAVHQCAVVWLGCPAQPTQRGGRRSSPGAAAWSACLHGAQPARPAACSQPSVAAGVARLRGPGSASSRARLAIRRRRKIAICFRTSRNRRSGVGDQVIWFFEFYEIEDPEHLFGEGCPHCNHCSGEDEAVEGDFQEFQDIDEFED
uniref:Uncharacterized protein n=1 Tax=Zea mays TaxID=4577 RepID=B6SGI5_MAIZE|nr:hypothetical protein [Zea mays]